MRQDEICDLCVLHQSQTHYIDLCVLFYSFIDPIFAAFAEQIVL